VEDRGIERRILKDKTYRSLKLKTAKVKDVPFLSPNLYLAFVSTFGNRHTNLEYLLVRGDGKKPRYSQGL